MQRAQDPSAQGACARLFGRPSGRLASYAHIIEARTPSIGAWHQRAGASCELFSTIALSLCLVDGGAHPPNLDCGVVGSQDAVSWYACTQTITAPGESVRFSLCALGLRLASRPQSKARAFGLGE